MLRIRLCLTLIACLVAAVPSPGGTQDLETLAAEAPSAEMYPDDEGVVLYEEIALTLHRDGRVERYTRHVRKYFTPYEIDSYSDPRIPFDSARQSLQILNWRTVMPSGTLVEKKDRSFNRVTPDEVGGAPDYATVQEMVSTHLGMEEGAVVEREYVVLDDIPGDGRMSGIEFLQSRLPVLEKVVRITIPDRTELRFEVVGGTAEYRKGETGGSLTHVWRVENQPGIFPEAVAGMERDALPHLVYSTLGGWEDLAEEWGSRIAECAAPTDELSEELDRILRASEDPTDRTRAIHQAICDEVRSVRYSFPLLGTVCRPAGIVYETGYGHRLDKAVLLLACLREAGLDAEPVLVSDSFRFAEDVPAVEQVPEVWVLAWGGERPIWMDPLHSLSSRAYKDLEGRRYLRLSSGGRPDAIPHRSSAENGCFAKIVADMTANGALEGEVRVRLTGVFSPFFEVSGTGDETKDFVEAIAAEFFDGAEVESYNLRELTHEQVALGFRFRTDGGEENGDPITLSLPGFAGFPEMAGFHGVRKERSVPLVLDGAFVAETRAEIDLWEGAEVGRLPESISGEASFGSYTVRCREEGRTVQFEKRMEILRSGIEPEEYTQLREWVLWDRNPTRATLVIGGGTESVP